MRKAVLGSLGAVLALGCATAKPPPPPPPPPIVAETLRIDEREQTLTGVEAVVLVELQNKGYEAVAATAAKYEVVMGGVVKARGEVPLSTVIPPGEARTVEIAVPVQYARSPEEIIALGAKQKTLEYAVRGVVVAGNGAFEFARASAVRVPRLPTITVTAIEAVSRVSAGLTFNASIEVKNPNPFPLPVEAIAYDLNLAGKPFGKGKIAKNATLKPASITTYDLAITREPGELKAMQLKPAGTVPYALSGVLECLTASVSLEKAGETRILRGD